MKFTITKKKDIDNNVTFFYKIMKYKIMIIVNFMQRREITTTLAYADDIIILGNTQ